MVESLIFLILPIISLWNRIITKATPWMTRADSFYGHPTTSEDPPLFYRFNRILRTRRVIPTIRRKYWTDNVLIQSNQNYKRKSYDFFDYFHDVKIRKINIL